MKLNRTWESFETYFCQAHEKIHNFFYAIAGDTKYSEHGNIITAHVTDGLQQFSFPITVTEICTYYSLSDSFVPLLIETINSTQTQIDNLTVAVIPESNISSVTNFFVPGAHLPSVSNFQLLQAQNYAIYVT